MPAHRFDVKVRFYELDPYGHLNHSAYIQFFETGRIELLEHVGMDLKSFAARGYRFVVNRINTSFDRPVYAGDTVTVETEIVELRRASSTWRQRLVRGGEVVARQELRAAITDNDGKPVRAPADLAEALAPYFVE
ncbi:MAG: acyl-CoA thioesterase [Acidimicrobiaceae bacterium]|nr:acyl-CoA thioesterase [Acidimicrobiaceae bacterium]MYE97506.1 acyl-CoA thioesterase [Acidimicrobiaceae bacterium]MYH44499.1 acyl-CoA thioesterase [Acidimicrobiaceae bacterium]MYI53941.1 acyl-CoA thioesterase [Acidimicrobiaceae bacterium]